MDLLGRAPWEDRVTQYRDEMRVIPWGPTCYGGFPRLLASLQLRSVLAHNHGIPERDVHVCALAMGMFLAVGERHYEVDGIPVTEVMDPLPPYPSQLSEV